MKRLIFIITIIYSVSASAQQIFQQTYGESQLDMAYYGVATSDSGNAKITFGIQAENLIAPTAYSVSPSIVFSKGRSLLFVGPKFNYKNNTDLPGSIWYSNVNLLGVHAGYGYSLKKEPKKFQPFLLYNLQMLTLKENDFPFKDGPEVIYSTAFIENLIGYQFLFTLVPKFYLTHSFLAGILVDYQYYSDYCDCRQPISSSDLFLSFNVNLGIRFLLIER